MFPGLKADTYVLRVSADGFAGYTTTVRRQHEPEVVLLPVLMATVPGLSTGNQLRALSVAIVALIAIASIGVVRRRTPLALKASGTLIVLALLTGGIL